MKRTSNSIESQGGAERAAERGPTDGDNGNGTARPHGGRIVCPFCGNINSRTDERCLRCDMPNTSTTRQATRSRIGPWYVLQSRNPSAPGMKFHTLLNLIAKGKVNDRSVVRGPTTHQLWRFAGRVRGISREFGLCYACSAAIEPTASQCSACHRSQLPPADPDALLDDAEAHLSRRPVLRDLTPGREAVPEAPTQASAIAPVAGSVVLSEAVAADAVPADAVMGDIVMGEAGATSADSIIESSNAILAALPEESAAQATVSSPVSIGPSGPMETPSMDIGAADAVAGETVSADAESADGESADGESADGALADGALADGALADGPRDASAPNTLPAPVATAPVSIMQALVAPTPPAGARPGSATANGQASLEQDLAMGSLTSVPRQSAPRGILSPEELAAAFSLDYNAANRGPVPFKSPEKPPSVKRLIVGIGAVAACAGVTLAVLSPSLRQRLGQWVDLSALSHATTPPAAVAAPSSGNGPAADSTATPPFTLPPTHDTLHDTSHDTANDANGVTTPDNTGSATPAPDVAPNNAPTPAGQGNRLASGPDFTPAPTPAPAYTPPLAIATPTQPAAMATAPSLAVTPAPPSLATAPTAPAPVALVPAQPTPPAVAPAPLPPTPAASAPVDPAPAVAPTPAPQPPVAVAPTPAMPRPSVPSDAYDEAKALFDDALDKESRHEYADAIYYWEQIEKLPTQYWPGGVTVHLKNDRAILAAERAQGK